jgi:hypothetical protein
MQVFGLLAARRGSRRLSIVGGPTDAANIAIRTIQKSIAGNIGAILQEIIVRNDLEQPTPTKWKTCHESERSPL